MEENRELVPKLGEYGFYRYGIAGATRSVPGCRKNDNVGFREKDIEPLKEPSMSSGFIRRAKILWDDDSFQTHQNRIRGQVGALSLLLEAVKLYVDTFLSSVSSMQRFGLEKPHLSRVFSMRRIIIRFNADLVKAIH